MSPKNPLGLMLAVAALSVGAAAGERATPAEAQSDAPEGRGPLQGRGTQAGLGRFQREGAAVR